MDSFVDLQGDAPATSKTREYFMAQHGYLREFDEGWDRDDREDRGRGFMFGDRDRSDRLGDRARERFSDDDRQWRRTHPDEWSSRGSDYGYGAADRSPRNFRSHQDDHYLSWRNRQLEALDRDYDDYCREREQQFHSDFDNWRRNRQQVESREEILELTESPDETVLESTPSAVSDATLGTNNGENTAPGRR